VSCVFKQGFTRIYTLWMMQTLQSAVSFCIQHALQQSTQVGRLPEGFAQEEPDNPCMPRGLMYLNMGICRTFRCKPAHSRSAPGGRDQSKARRSLPKKW
jgi:hypothetical protein